MAAGTPAMALTASELCGAERRGETSFSSRQHWQQRKATAEPKSSLRTDLRQQASQRVCLGPSQGRKIPSAKKSAVAIGSLLLLESELESKSQSQSHSSSSSFSQPNLSIPTGSRSAVRRAKAFAYTFCVQACARRASRFGATEEVPVERLDCIGYDYTEDEIETAPMNEREEGTLSKQACERIGSKCLRRLKRATGSRA